MFLWIFAQLWRATYRVAADQSGEMISGLTLNDTLWYLMVTEAIILSTFYKGLRRYESGSAIHAQI
jgi:hypothetical protein